MTTAVKARKAIAPVTPVRRLRFDGSKLDRLFFAQVREDAQLEIAALRPASDKRIVVISSGGCTALSLLASGAGDVIAVDLNQAQNHLTELKAVAASTLTPRRAVRFLGGGPALPSYRSRVYRWLRHNLSAECAEYWDQRRGQIEAGVLNVGVSERFIAVVVAALRTFVHSRERIQQLLACSTLEQQRSFYNRVWNSRRWRALFRVLLNRAVFNRTYDPAFFARVENPSFARHFYELAQHALTRLPLRDNYFLQHMLTGEYPRGVHGGLPRYLEAAGSAAMQDAASRLTLVDAPLLAWLRSCESRSIDGFAISNICEWLEPHDINALFQEIVRTAAPGARLCFRNFVGWTEVPEPFRNVIVEDRAVGEALIARDRSVVQRRFAACRIVRPV